MVDREKKEKAFLAKIKAKLPELKKLLEEVCGDSIYEDCIYRFYRQSFKVYARIQDIQTAKEINCYNLV